MRYASLLRTTVLPTILVIGSAAGSAHADCNDPFGKPNEVLDFQVRLRRADWQLLLDSKIRNVDTFAMVDSPACGDKFPKVKAEFRCGNSGPWIPIGLRKKKGTERGIEAPDKPPLKIDFNEDFMGTVGEARGQRWPAAMGELGYRKLTLNNGQGNKPPDTDMLPPLRLPILLTEHVALRLLKKEVVAVPATAFAKLTLYFEDRPEGEYHGVYVLVEDVDRTGITRRWGKADGRLVKASTPDCTAEMQFDDGGPNAAARAFEEWIAKDPAMYPGRWLEESKKGLDLDTLLRQEAIREILVNGNDTITNSRAYLVWEQWGLGNNWLAYDPKAGVRQFMPWDVDLTFGNQRGACATITASMTGQRLQCAYDLPLLDWCNPMPTILSTPQTKSKVGLATTCHPEIQRRYLEVMCQLTNGPLSADEIIKVWDQADAAVRPAIALEKDPVWKGLDPLDRSAFKSHAAEYDRIRDWIPKRIKSVQEQITAKGVACSPGCPAGAKDACSYSGCAGERVCSNNVWTECRQVDPACPARAAVKPDPAKPDDSGGFGCTQAGPVRSSGFARVAAPVAIFLVLVGRRRSRTRRGVSGGAGVR